MRGTSDYAQESREKKWFTAKKMDNIFFCDNFGSNKCECQIGADSENIYAKFVATYLSLRPPNSASLFTCDLKY